MFTKYEKPHLGRLLFYQITQRHIAASLLSSYPLCISNCKRFVREILFIFYITCSGSDLVFNTTKSIIRKSIDNHDYRTNMFAKTN